MRSFDLTPVWRSTIGFDRVLDLLDDSMHWTNDDNYPPYNIERVGEDQYRVSLAVAGFAPEDISITAEQDVLTVEGCKSANGGHEYLYHGISERPFRHVFNLANHVQVREAALNSGLLQIELVRELPEAMKPRKIAIATATNDNQKLEQKKAA